MRENDEVELNSDGWPVDAIARITGRIFRFASGHHRIDRHVPDRERPGRLRALGGLNLPTTSSGWWLVPLSIASTFSSVGRMMGM